MDTTIRFRRRLLAAAVGAAPVLLALGNALFPKGTFQYVGTTDKARKVLSATAAAPNRVFAASLIGLAGFVLLGVAFGVIASLIRRRGGAAATAGAVLGGIGALGAVLVVSWLGLSVYAASQAHTTQDAKAAYLVSLLKGTQLGDIAGACFLPGLVLGSVLLAVGLFRSRRVARSLAVVFPLAVVLATVLAPQGPAGGLMGIPLVVVMVLLAREIGREAAVPADPDAAAAPSTYAATTF